MGSCGLLRHSVQPLHRIFLCLISAAKNIPIDIKTAHTADRLVSGTPSGMRNPGSLPTIERRNLGVNLSLDGTHSSQNADFGGKFCVESL